MKLSKAITISIIAHILMIIMLALNFHFSKIKPKSSVNPRQMNATAVNSASAKSLLKNIKQKEINKKNKEIERLREVKKRKEIEREKQIDIEKKAEEKKRKKKQDAENEKKKKEQKAVSDKKKRTADEKAKKEKIALEKKKKDDKIKAAEAEKKRKEKVEADRKKKLEQERKRKEAEAQAAVEREMERQMAAETEALNSAHREQVMTEVDKYRLLIENKIQRNWIEPENKGFCNFRMKLAPGGLVLNVTSVSGDQLHCETGQRAIYKAEPLPVSSDPDVFAELKDSYFQLKNVED